MVDRKYFVEVSETTSSEPLQTERCSDCELEFPQDNVECGPDGELRCWTCHENARVSFLYCDNCGVYIDKLLPNGDVPEGVYIVEGSVTCQECYDCHSVTCAQCGDAFWADNTYYSSRYDETYCEDCWYDLGRDRLGYYIHEYHGSNASDWLWYGEGEHDFDAKHQFGIELEMFVREPDMLAEVVSKKHDTVLFFEEDGSVDLEMVSARFTEQGWERKGMPAIKTLCDTMRDYGARTDWKQGCGIHITVSGPDGENADRVARNLIAIGVVFEKELVKASCRTIKEMHWAKPLKSHWKGSTRVNAAVIDEVTRDRYRLFNIKNRRWSYTGRGPIVEFRLWRSSSIPERVDGVAKMSLALYKAAEKCSMNDIIYAIDLRDFLEGLGLWEDVFEQVLLGKESVWYTGNKEETSNE